MIAATEIFCLNEKGKRHNNEDSIHPQKGHATASDNLFIVCDGVGGENKGEVASEIVCTSIYHHIKEQEGSLPDRRRSIERAVIYASQKLAEYAAEHASAKRMSTTLSLVLLGRHSVTAAWCGDTRIHHIRDGRILWKSEDHSLVQELVKRREISPLEARSHPNKNIITRSLSAMGTNNTVDFYEITDCRNNDFFLLCTDGFLEQIDDDAIHAVLNNKETNKEQAFFKLCDGKTRDNFSMYLVRVTGPEQTRSPGSRAALRTFLIILICIACIIFLFLWIRKDD